MSTEWTSSKIGLTITLALLPLIASFIIGVMFRPGKWYWNLKKPCGFPMMIVYIIVWTILYPMIGAAMPIALFNTGTSNKWWALPVINIAVSLMFAPIFFGLNSIVGGLIISFLSFALGFGTFWQYAVDQKDNLAAGLMVPYVIWTLFAVYLMYALYQCNCPQPKAVKECVTVRRTRSVR